MAAERCSETLFQEVPGYPRTSWSSDNDGHLEPPGRKLRMADCDMGSFAPYPSNSFAHVSPAASTDVIPTSA
eukprot:5056356-Prymnesium_polylepis.2